MIELKDPCHAANVGGENIEEERWDWGECSTVPGLNTDTILVLLLQCNANSLLRSTFLAGLGIAKHIRTSLSILDRAHDLNWYLAAHTWRRFDNPMPLSPPFDNQKYGPNIHPQYLSLHVPGTELGSSCGVLHVSMHPWIVHGRYYVSMYVSTWAATVQYVLSYYYAVTWKLGVCMVQTQWTP